MSNYSLIASWSTKDALPSSNPLKSVSATEIGLEFSAISAMSATKEDTANKGVSGGYVGLDSNLIAQAGGINVTGANIPVTGLYRQTTNTLSFASSSTNRGFINSNGAWSMAGVVAGTSPTLTVNASAGGLASQLIVGNAGVTSFTGLTAMGLVLTGGTGTTDFTGIDWATGGTGTAIKARIAVVFTGGGSQMSFGTSNSYVSGVTNQALTINQNGAVSIAQPSTGVAFTATGTGSGPVFLLDAQGNASIGTFNSNAASGGFIGIQRSATIKHWFGDANALASGSVDDTCIRSAGQIVFSPASSGIKVIISAVGGLTVSPTSSTGITINQATSATVALNLVDPGANNTQLRLQTTNTQCLIVPTGTANPTLELWNAGSAAISIAATRAVTINAPSGGVALSASANATNFSASFSGGLGVNIGAPASGNQALQVSGVSGTHSTQIADSANTQFNAGYLEIPVLNKATPYTAVLSDSGKCLFYNGTGAAAFTIPANASVAYPTGTALTFINDATGATNMTIAITTDTMVLAGTTTTGSRTLAQGGMATAVKVTATRWYISGNGLS